MIDENEVVMERRTGDAELVKRVTALEGNQVLIMAELKENTAATKRVEKNTAGMVSLFEEGRAAFRLFNRAAFALRWLVKFFALCVGVVVLPPTILYMIFHQGHPPEFFREWWDIFNYKE